MDSTIDRRADAAPPAATPEIDDPPTVRPVPRVDDAPARLADAVRRHNERPPAGDGAAATTVEGNPLRAWDSVRPRQDDIAAWRWREGEWRWEDALDRHVPAPEWSKPPIAGVFDGYRLPLDSVLEMHLHKHAPAEARTIAPGVMAHVAAAMSAGKLTAADEVGDLVPLMQRMTVDRELDVARGAESLRSRGAPAEMEPYAKLIPRMATFFQDGTANHHLEADDHGGTNVATMSSLMAIAAGHDSNIPRPNYYAGVGNSIDMPTPIRRTIGQGTGAGIGRIENDVEADFRATLAAGITDAAVFGFSRGSAGAVESTNRFQDIGSELNIPYRLRHLSLLDTVAAIGPTGEGTGSLRLQPPRDGGKPERMWHAIALDEARDKFSLVDVGVSGVDNIIKDVFPAAHSDVGGGYANKSHSNIVLHRAIEEARRSGVPMPTLEEVVIRHPLEAEKFLPYLHQDHHAPRHLEEGWYTSQTLRVIPADAKGAEFPQKILRERVEVIRNPDHDFDRRSEPFRASPPILEHVDPGGRFVFSPHDTPDGQEPTRTVRSPRRDHDLDRGGIPLLVENDNGSILVRPIGDQSPPDAERHDRRR